MYICKIRVSCGLKATQGAMTHCTQNHYGGGGTHECLIIAFSEVDSSATLNTYLYWSMLSLYLPSCPAYTTYSVSRRSLAQMEVGNPT